MTWKGRYSPEPLNEGSGLRDQIDERFANLIQSQSLLGSMVPASIPHDTVSTAKTRVFYSPSSAGNYTLSATSLTEVDAVNLAGTINCSGADVEIKCRARAASAGTSGAIALGFTWDGEDVESGGSWYWDSTAIVGPSFWTVIESPRPGLRRFALSYLRETADGILYSGAGNSIELLAREI